MSTFDATAYGTVGMWLKADALPQVAGAVATWTDSGPGGHSPAQATAANRPALVLGASPTGLAVVRFDGVNDVMVVPGYLPGNAASSALEIFAAIKVNSNTTGAANLLDTRGTSSGGWLFRMVSTTSTLFAWTGAFPSLSDTVGLTAWHLLEVSQAAGSNKIGHDGVFGAPVSPTPFTVSAVSGLAIAENVNGASFLGCDVGEILLYESGVSNRAAIESYFKSKWGTP